MVPRRTTLENTSNPDKLQLHRDQGWPILYQTSEFSEYQYGWSD